MNVIISIHTSHNYQVNNRKEKHTKVSFPKSRFPALVKSTDSTATSHPDTFGPTRAPSARAIIWWPKQIPITGLWWMR